MGSITVKSLGGRANALQTSIALSGAGRIMPADAAATGLHPVVFLTLVASLTIMMLAYFILFWRLPDVVFMLVISFGFLLFYTGLPILMLRYEFSGRQTVPEFIDRPLLIWTGRISGGDAWLQICLVPVMLALAAICLCLVIAAIR